MSSCRGFSLLPSSVLDVSGAFPEVSGSIEGVSRKVSQMISVSSSFRMTIHDFDNCSSHHSPTSFPMSDYLSDSTCSAGVRSKPRIIEGLVKGRKAVAGI